MAENSEILHGEDIAGLRIARQPDWKIGYFVEESHPFHNNDFELKWSHLTAGQRKPNGPGTNQIAHTVTILIRGEFKLLFPDTDEEYLMKNEGEYVYYSPGVKHDWECVSDTFIITLRWPSVKDDQVQ